MDHTPWLPPRTHSEPAAPASSPIEPERPPLLRRIGTAILAIGALIAKFAAKLKLLLVALPKLKLLTTSASMLVSIAAYSLFFGWTFAVGFVLLLLVHEMGHVIQLRREGIPASAPMFIPFWAPWWRPSRWGRTPPPRRAWDWPARCSAPSAPPR